MDKTQINTGQKPGHQRSLCSIISEKLCLSSRRDHKENQDQFSTTGTTKIDEKKRRDDKKGTNKYEIKTVMKKLTRTTHYLPKALLSPYAYEDGKESCDTCNFDKENYKSMMKSIKVIDLIVNDVINKAQEEMIEKEGERDKEKYKIAETKGGTKISFQLEVYCQQNIDHNLKCVIIKLQKTIGDVLLQVCHCKMKKIPEDEKCKKYDLSVNILEHLKFEYINLTNNVIQLFGTPTKQKGSPNICVACIKEELTDCTEIMEGMLKTGRNLKVTMRNDCVGEEKCCSRTYPHVHAIVQDKHVVLKFEMPFRISPSSSSKADRPKLKSDDYDVKNYPCPDDEWPEYFQPDPIEECSESLKEKSSFPKEEPTKILPFKESLKEYQRNSPRFSNLSVKSLRDVSLESKDSEKEQPTTYNPIKRTCKVSVKDDSFLPSAKVSKSKSSVDTVPERSTSNAAVKEEPTPGPKASKNRSSIRSSTSSIGSSGPKAKDNYSSKSELFCGCNFNEVDDKLMKSYNSDDNTNLQQPRPFPVGQSQDKDDSSQKSRLLKKDDSLQKSRSSVIVRKENEVMNPQKPKLEKSDSDTSEESMLLSEEEIESNDSIPPVKRQKQVSFNPEYNNQKILYMGKQVTHSVFQTGEIKPHPIFKNKCNDREPLATVSAISSFNIDKSRKSVIPAVDSVVLVKNKYPSFRQPKTSNELIKTSTETKCPANVLQKESKDQITSNVQPTMAMLEKKSSKSLNKQQINEVLRDLGAATLLSVSLPAECCKSNKSTKDFKHLSDLPYSASLHSLPLDQNDLDHITKVVEKLISTQDIVLDPDREDDWEIQYGNEPEKEKGNKSEWHNAFTARDSASNISIEVQTNKPLTTKRIPTIKNSKEKTNLPTIREEEDERSRKSSVSINKNGNDNLVNRNMPTKPTELRFFTVEYSNGLNKFKTSVEANEREKRLMPNKYINGVFELNSQESNFKKIEEFNQEHILSKNKLNKCYKKFNIKPLDEMIMLDVIYLALNDNVMENTSNSYSNILKPFNKQLLNFNKGNIQYKNKQNISTNSSLVRETEDLGEKSITNQGTLNTYNRNYCSSSHSILKTSKGSLEGKIYFDCTSNNCIDKVCRPTSDSIVTVKNEKDSSNRLDKKCDNKSLECSMNGKVCNTAAIICSENKQIQNTENKLQNELIHNEPPTNIFNCDVTNNSKNTEETYFNCLSMNDLAKYNCAVYPFLYAFQKMTANNNKILQPLEKISYSNCINSFLIVRILKHHTLNIRSYVIGRKSFIKIVKYCYPSRSKVYRHTGKMTIFESNKLKIFKPDMISTKVKEDSNRDRSTTEISSKNHKTTTNFKKDFSLSKRHTIVKDLQKLNFKAMEEVTISEEESCKNHKNKNVSIVFDKTSNLSFKVNHSGEDLHVENSDKNCLLKDERLLHLSERHNQSMTDSLEKNLRNMADKTLLQSDGSVLPFCYLNNVDSLRICVKGERLRSDYGY